MRIQWRIQVAASHTGHYLKDVLARRPVKRKEAAE